MRKNLEDLWEQLWKGIDELTGEFHDNLVFIGGVAVYLHVIQRTSQQDPANLIEFSHDGDFMISIEDFGVLTDILDVTPTPRLHKHQIDLHGIDFDVYRDRYHALVVPFAEALAASTTILAPPINKQIRVACLEHLLVLKLEAFSERHASSKGDKDERDIIRILYTMQPPVNIDLIAPYWTEEMQELLVGIKKSPEYMVLTQNNSHVAGKLRRAISKQIDGIVGAL